MYRSVTFVRRHYARVHDSVLHLHGAVVMRIRKGCWQVHNRVALSGDNGKFSKCVLRQVTTPHDAVAHQVLID